MRRRALIANIAGATVWPLAAHAQQAGRVYRLAVLVTGVGDSAETRAGLNALLQGLKDLGYFEGRNIVIELRSADGRIERLPDLARELVDLKVDLIYAGATPAGRAAQQATSTIPIVVSAMGDPVGDRLVVSLARPGGNVTGTTFLGPELVPKRLALLKELMPGLSRVAVLWHAAAFGEITTASMRKEADDAAARLGLQLQFTEARSPDDLDTAFAAVARTQAEAVFQFPSPMLYLARKRFVDLAAMHRLPGMYNAREFVQLGGLIGYGSDLLHLSRQAATYIDKILKGAKPAELPVEQPTTFELFINLKTAKALGLTIPPSILARADEVIE
jgi:putative ABC transport system substrate-binding protein